MRGDPDLIAGARRRVEAWGGSVHPHYRAAWADLLDGPLEPLLAVLETDDERSRDLRQVSPFAGVIDAPTRWRLWREARREPA